MMKMFLLGVERRSGTAKSTGRKFDFTQVHTTASVDAIQTENYSVAGFGLKPVVLNAESGIEKLFDGLELPGWYECDIGSRVGMNGELVAALVGIKAAK